VDKHEIEICNCPTKKMTADFFTKLLQGQLFHKLRSVIMGWENFENIEGDICSTDKKECVEKTNNSNGLTHSTNDES